MVTTRFEDVVVFQMRQFSLGRDKVTGGYFLSTPVSGWMRSVSYEACFRIDEREFEAFRADPDSAEQFLEDCRNDHHADRRIEHPK